MAIIRLFLMDNSARPSKKPVGRKPPSTLFASAQLSRPYFPVRGLAQSAVLHLIGFTIAYFFTSFPVALPKHPVEREKIVMLDLNDPMSMMFLPVFDGGSSGKGIPAKRIRSERRPKPAEPPATTTQGFSYPGPQRVISDVEGPTNRSQTLLQPDLEVAPILPPPLLIPNIVQIAEVTKLPKLEEPPPPEPEEPQPESPAPEPEPPEPEPKPAEPPKPVEPPKPEPKPVLAPKPEPKPPAPVPKPVELPKQIEVPKIEPKPVVIPKLEPQPPEPEPKPVEPPKLEPKRAEPVPKPAEPPRPVELPKPEPKPAVVPKPEPKPPEPPKPEPKREATQKPEPPPKPAETKTPQPVSDSTIPAPKRAEPAADEQKANEPSREFPESSAVPGASRDILSLSPMPSDPDKKADIPPGEARGRFVISPDAGLNGSDAEPGFKTGTPSPKIGIGNTAGAPARKGVAKGPPSASAKKEPAGDSGNGKSTSSGNGAKKPFAGITIMGGEYEPGSDPETPPVTRAVRPLQTAYGLNITSTEDSGGGLPFFGVFSHEQIYTVYLDMRTVETDQDPSWTLEFALMQDSASSYAVRDLDRALQGFVLPFPSFKEKPAWPAGLARKYPGRMLIVYGMVNTDGKMEQISIKDSPDPLLNEPVIKALGKWVFRPAQSEGQPVAAKALFGIPIWAPE